VVDDRQRELGVLLWPAILAGQEVRGIPPGVAGVSSAKLKVSDDAMRPVAGEFNGERIVGRAWPVADNQLVLLELHY